MAPIRLRHPAGVTTLDVDLDTQTVDDLQALIFSTCEIAPADQEIRYGYPPKLLDYVNGPLHSVPITRGEQIIVTSKPGARANPPSSSSSSTPSTSAPIEPPSSSLPTPAPSVKVINETLSAPTPPSVPAAANRPQSPLAQGDIPLENAESVAMPGRDAGYLQLRVVPDDNSCLFSAVGVVFEGGIEAASSLRRVVADAIRNDPETYPDVILGQPRSSYIDKILKPETWGGAIELSILAKHYRTEISSFDVQTGRCDRFGEGEYDSRCVLVYSGIHYDAISLSPIPVSPPSFHTTVFPVADQTVLMTAEKLIAQLRARHYYTDTATFDLRCGTCGKGLKGEAGARDHAMQTGHVDFGEY